MRSPRPPALSSLRKQYPGKVVFFICAADPVDGHITVAGACDPGKVPPGPDAFTRAAMLAWGALDTGLGKGGK